MKKNIFGILLHVVAKMGNISINISILDLAFFFSILQSVIEIQLWKKN